MIYKYECPKCESQWEFSIEAQDTAKPSAERCSKCKVQGTLKKVTIPDSDYSKAWTTSKNFELVKPGFIGRNQAEGIRTPAQQEALYTKVIAQKRMLAGKAKRHRRGSKRGHGELRHVGSIPTELFRAVQRTSGDTHVWKRGGRDLLRKHGLLFDD